MDDASLVNINTYEHSIKFESLSIWVGRKMFVSPFTRRFAKEGGMTFITAICKKDKKSEGEQRQGDGTKFYTHLQDRIPDLATTATISFTIVFPWCVVAIFRTGSRARFPVFRPTPTARATTRSLLFSSMFVTLVREHTNG